MSVRERTASPVSAVESGGEGESAARFERECTEVLALAAEVVQLAGEDSRRKAEELKRRVAALAGRWPGAMVQPLLQRLLDDPRLGAHPDEAGELLRRALVAAQQQLGFPWALAVHPDDLAHLAPRPPRVQRGLVARALAFVSAWLALAFSALVTFFSLAALERRPVDLVVGLIAALGAAGMAHAFAVMVTVTRKEPRRPGVLTALRGLAWSWVLGPAGALATSLAAGSGYGGDSTVLLAGLVAAAPSMLTAALCGVAAWRLAPEEPPSLPPRA